MTNSWQLSKQQSYGSGTQVNNRPSYSPLTQSHYQQRLEKVGDDDKPCNDFTDEKTYVLTDNAKIAVASKFFSDENYTLENSQKGKKQRDTSDSARKSGKVSKKSSFKTTKRSMASAKNRRVEPASQQDSNMDKKFEQSETIFA